MSWLATIAAALFKTLLDWFGRRRDDGRGREAEQAAAVASAETETQTEIAEMIDDQRKAAVDCAATPSDLARRLRERAEAIEVGSGDGKARDGSRP